MIETYAASLDVPFIHSLAASSRVPETTDRGGLPENQGHSQTVGQPERSIS